MALVWAKAAFNFDSYNFKSLDAYVDAAQITTDNPHGFNFQGFIYEDYAVINKNGDSIVIGGTGWNMGASDDDVMSGTIYGLQGAITYADINTWSGIEKISFDLMEFARAVATSDTKDDFAILRRELAGNDTFNLSAYNDLARGFAGNDVMNAGGGNDTIFGNEGADTLRGGAGQDKLNGGAGADILVGGAGKDQLNAGSDAARDVFDFNSRADSGAGWSSRDTILNFKSGTDDIDLRDIDATAGTSGNDAFAWGGKTAAAHSVWWSTSNGNTLLSADVNGDTTADFQLQLNGVTSLVSGDVLL